MSEQFSSTSHIPSSNDLRILVRADCHFVDQRGWYFLQLKAIDRTMTSRSLYEPSRLRRPVIIADHQRRGSDGIYQNVAQIRGGNAEKFALNG